MDIKLKDELLNALCDGPLENHIAINLPVVLEQFKIDFKTLQLALIEFKDLGLISDLNIRQTSEVFYLTLSYRAKSFIDSGGFQAEKAFSDLQMQKLQLEIEKLTLEVNKLYESNPTLAERMLSMVANIATIAGTVIK